MIPQIPFKTVTPIKTANTILIQELRPVLSNNVTEAGVSALFPNTGKNNKSTIRVSNVQQIKEIYLSMHALFSSSAAIMISSEQIRSSIVTEKYLEISFRESRFGYPLPDSHLEIAVLETNRASASCSCVSPLFFRSSCSFSLNSIYRLPRVLFCSFPVSKKNR